MKKTENAILKFFIKNVDLEIFKILTRKIFIISYVFFFSFGIYFIYFYCSYTLLEHINTYGNQIKPNQILFPFPPKPISSTSSTIYTPSNLFPTTFLNLLYFNYILNIIYY